jgi:hypothetical protein
MAMDNLPSDRWMPVFVVQPRVRTLRSQGPDDEAARSRPAEPPETWQRVGTAFLAPDGTWHVGVTMLPLNGRFVMRPPERGEAPEDITFVRG